MTDKPKRPIGADVRHLIVLEELGGEGSVAELCRREGKATSLFYI
jgi:hypothetical protein